jgi:MYXO-CTERM domain-containing protein
VTIDTAIEALRTEPAAACIERLASEDSLWNRSQCEGGSGLDSVDGSAPAEETGTATEGCACGLAAAAESPGSMALTGAALLAALIARRQRRPT